MTSILPNNPVAELSDAKMEQLADLLERAGCGDLRTPEGRKTIAAVFVMARALAAEADMIRAEDELKAATQHWREFSFRLDSEAVA